MGKVGRGMPGFQETGIHAGIRIDPDDDVGRRARGRRDGDRIDHPAIDQPLARRMRSGLKTPEDGRPRPRDKKKKK